MESGKQRLFSASDASSFRAFSQLADSINSIPTRVLKPRPPNPSKGHIYLVKFHEEVSDCYITRLPRNLIRLIVSYNVLTDFLNLSVSCKPFSKLLTDKYIAYTVADGLQFYGEGTFGYTDLLDLARTQELTTEGKAVKEYVTVRPEFARMFYIDLKTTRFFSLYRDCIVEGAFVRYNDSLEVVRMRPGIDGVTATDVNSNNLTVICASDGQLAISFDDLSVKSTHLLDPEPTKSVKFICERRQIVVHKAKSVVIFSTSLIFLHKIPFEDKLLTLLYVPSPDKYVFAVADAFTTITCFVLKGGKAVQTYKSQFDTGGNIVDVIMHRSDGERGKTDYLILLFDNETVQINREVHRKYGKIQMKNGVLVAIGDVKIDFFAVNAGNRSFSVVNTVILKGNLQYPIVGEFWKTKALIITRKAANWCKKEGQNGVFPVFSSAFPALSDVFSTTFGEFVIIRGVFHVNRPIPGTHKTTEMDVPCCIVYNFTGNSLVGRSAAAVEEMAGKVADAEWFLREEEKKREKKAI